MEYSLKLFLGILIVALASAWSQSSNEPTSTEVIEAFLNALGGVEKWKNLKTLQVGGVHEQGGESTTFYSYYSHIDSRMKYESDKLTLINSPTEFWLKANGRDWQDFSKVNAMIGRTSYGSLLKELKVLMHPATFLLRIYVDRPQVLELTENPIEDSNDIALVLVPDKAMDNHKNASFTYYYLFNSSTKLLNKMVTLDEEGDIVKIMSYSDYREVDGFTISCTQEEVTMKTAQAGLGLPSFVEGAIVTDTYTSFKFNEEIDPKVFEVE